MKPILSVMLLLRCLSTWEITFHNNHSFIIFIYCRKGSHFGKLKSADEVLQMLGSYGMITLLEIEFPGHEWDTLTTILDSGILEVLTKDGRFWLVLAPTPDQCPDSDSSCSDTDSVSDSDPTTY